MKISSPAPPCRQSSLCDSLPPSFSSTQTPKKCGESTSLLGSFDSAKDYTEIRQNLREHPLQPDGALRRNLIFFLKSISAEPVLFLNAMGFTIKTIFATKLVLDKVCLNYFEFPLEVCQNLTAHSEAHVEVQRVATGIIMVKDLISALPGVFFVLFLGAWSDRHGRKLPMLLPIIGNFLMTFVYLINALLRWLPAEYIILAAIPRALSGGLVTLLMATFSYVSDTSDVRSRTMRIAFMDFMMFVGVPLGLYLSNVIYVSLDYVGVFGISAAVYVVCIVYVLVNIKNTRAPSSQTGRQTVGEHRLCDIFDCDNIKDSFRTTFRPREGNRRFQILAFMTTFCLLQFCFGAEPLVYLYTEAQYRWNYAQYTNLTIYTVVMTSIGTSLLLPLLSYKLRIDDPILGLVGSVSKASGLCIQTIITSSPLWLFVAASVAFMGGLPLIVTRAGISKLISADEVGKMFSILGAFDAVIPLMSGPSYTFLYDFTVSTHPGSIFILSIACSGTAAVIYLVLIIMRKTSNAYRHDVITG